ncbi:NADPH-dependent ferric siderophore reductase, contains FAD-binding and SIP domains [Mucilaginibacter sp. OK268]|jgi:NADPH-dependent ferric siderophore reductase|uniref:SIP domain-containing protein n=1 Tax=Mucilaginibacter sp. OK268 TaxID=1881048 RepID=UPI00088D58B3|nr:SIP domain-containing protein [Mucilaginibacter sp. OK268]SDP97748.1 NADPH-dependent ferric siderophore reductase, contains FAD-binding and SIP domains [Mucilaginibacter sp. OK268]
METSTFQKIKRKAGKLFENRLQSGRVLEVRHWEPSTLIEVDLHLPFADIAQWNEIPYIKFRVDDFTFRDYTPSGWDAETSTCTIYIDAAHNGPGSGWAQQLKKDDVVSYLKIGSTDHSPVATSAVVALGDESSMGHLLALQKMVLPHTRFSGGLVIGNEHHRKLFHEYFWSPLQPVARKDIFGHHSLIEWVLEQQYSLENTVFYLAGNNTMVAQLRKLLKNQGYPSGQIKVQGFWS